MMIFEYYEDINVIREISKNCFKSEVKLIKKSSDCNFNYINFNKSE
jgi:hypothetical protein